MRKKKIAAIAVILVCIAVLGMGVHAYLTKEAVARNVITTGAIDITLVERQMVGGQLQDYPDERLTIMPGSRVSKVVTVTNGAEAQPAYVRAMVDVTVLDPAGAEMQLAEDVLARIVSIACDSSNWTEKEGWWYYNEPLRTGAETPALFEEVVFAGPEMTNEYQNCTIEIEVTAQGVQVKNNPGSSALDAVGWTA